MILTKGDRVALEKEDGLPAAAFGPGRTSAPRAAVAAAADAFPGAFTVEDLRSAVRDEDDTIAMATVYRAVAAMVEHGFIEHVGERDGAALYARCRADGHHHHLVCTGCGAVEEAPCPLGSCAPQLETRGFVVTGHEVRLYGLCPRCAPEGITRTGGRV